MAVLMERGLQLGKRSFTVLLKRVSTMDCITSSLIPDSMLALQYPSTVGLTYLMFA